jgi:hypothetical protein
MPAEDKNEPLHSYKAEENKDGNTVGSGNNTNEMTNLWMIIKIQRF